MECVDTFEEIFELNQKLTEGIDLTELLDPYLFTNHRDIVNALFEVYYDISELYMEKLHDPQTKYKIKN